MTARLIDASGREHAPDEQGAALAAGGTASATNAHATRATTKKRDFISELLVR